MIPISPLTRVGEQHRTLRDAVLDELRELIVEGVLPQGARLVEHDLAEQFAVSRVPLREAILQLEAEGLVRKLPRRGSVVATLTAKDVADLLDIREALEGLAAARTAQLSADADRAVLRQRLDQARTAADRGDVSVVARLNLAFHADLVRIADNDLLTTMVAPLQSRMRWLFRLLTTGTGDPGVMCREHSTIYDAIAAGDRDRAERLAREHVANTREPTLRLLRALTTPVPHPDRGMSS